jgi:hypothetical protein
MPSSPNRKPRSSLPDPPVGASTAQIVLCRRPLERNARRCRVPPSVGYATGLPVNIGAIAAATAAGRRAAPICRRVAQPCVDGPDTISYGPRTNFDSSPEGVPLRPWAGREARNLAEVAPVARKVPACRSVDASRQSCSADNDGPEISVSTFALQHARPDQLNGTRVDQDGDRTG